MTRSSSAPGTGPSADARNDRLLAPTRWTAMAVIPVLVAAFVILYIFPGRTMHLWGWTIRPEMSALIMGGGYLAGAYFFFRVVRAREWHRVGVGFVAITVFSTLLLATTVLHWDRFNHDHISFWAWIVLYGSTPVLLPVLWAKNRRTDPHVLADGDVRLPRSVRAVVALGGALQLGVAVVMFGWPHAAIRWWPWALDTATSRSVSAFVAFPAITWLWFLFDDRWSSFRVTEHTATIGLVLIGVGALRATDEFRSGWYGPLFGVLLVLAVAMNVALMMIMDRRRRPAEVTAPIH